MTVSEVAPWPTVSSYPASPTRKPGDLETRSVSYRNLGGISGPAQAWKRRGVKSGTTTGVRSTGTTTNYQLHTQERPPTREPASIMGVGTPGGEDTRVFDHYPNGLSVPVYLNPLSVRPHWSTRLLPGGPRSGSFRWWGNRYPTWVGFRPGSLGPRAYLVRPYPSRHVSGANHRLLPHDSPRPRTTPTHANLTPVRESTVCRGRGRYRVSGRSVRTQGPPERSGESDTYRGSLRYSGPRTVAPRPRITRPTTGSRWTTQAGAWSEGEGRERRPDREDPHRVTE